MEEIGFFDLEDHLISRLKAAGPRVRTVAGLDDLAAAANQAEFAPALFVLYDGYQVLEAQEDGSTRVEQTWLIVTVVRNVSQPGRDGSTNALRQTAKPIIDGVLASLVGWTPSPRIKPLKLANSYKSKNVADLGLYPLSFSTRFTIRAVN